MTDQTYASANPPKTAATWSSLLAQTTMLRRFVSALLVAAVYLASAKLGLSLAFVAEQVSAVWPPTGIALAAILLFGYQVWPGIALGAFVANVTTNEPILTACGISLGNTLEALVAAWILRRLVGFDNALERVKDAIGLIVISAFLSTMVSATIGVTSLCLGRVYLPALERTIEWTDFASLWSVWWLGDAIGALVVAPVLLTWFSTPGNFLWRRPIESLILFVGLVATIWIVFFGGITTTLGGASLGYVVFPFVVWAALRIDQPRTTAVTIVASGLTIWATLQGLGPFGSGPLHERLLLLQVYMGVVAVTSLLLGSALAERRRAEAVLKEADRRKDEFLATLAHELRNPLAPIRAGVDLMRLGGSHKIQDGEVLDMLDRQVQQITRLVDDLLDVSRVTRGKVQLQWQPVDLKAIVEQAIETCRPLIDAQGHDLTVSFPEEPLRLTADPIRLAQVFANLLNNAAKYSDRGGRISLAAFREGSEAVVRIRDTGHGIDQIVLPRVFDLFVQEDRSLTRTGGGLGIGLTLVQSLVKMHGGSVAAHSEGSGKGSEFVVRLPRFSAPRESTNAPPEEIITHDVPGTSRRVLIVDDNRDAARSLELLLKSGGHEVRTAFTGSDGVEIALSYPPDVVLLDIGLPEMDGYQVARQIRELPGGKATVLFALTGWGQPEDRRKAIDAGFDAHLTKPVDYRVLMSLFKLRTAVASHERR
ncbi:MAG: MASE1 domain-containing protein [Planctomycetes bacterium]|nr:MASE1 domain-containing protein [Planctomycetota bacterium]